MDTNEGQNISGGAKKKPQLFEDLPRHEQAAMVIHTALAAKASGLPLVANEADHAGQIGFLIWIPDYTLKSGAVVEAKLK